jgi:hypothetical protein
MLYLGYRVEHLNYLPTYSPSLIESILSNYGVFFKYRNQTILLHHYYTPALLKQMIEYFFNGLVICQLAMCQFRPQAVGTASKVLGKNWLGLTTYICDLTIVRVECLTLEVYYELRANGLDPILQLFTDPLELQIHHGSLKVKTILGQVKLGYATSLG